VVKASGWESKLSGFKPRRLQATFDPRLPKKILQKYSQPYSVPLMIDFARRTLKDLKKPDCMYQSIPHLHPWTAGLNFTKFYTGLAPCSRIVPPTPLGSHRIKSRTWRAKVRPWIDLKFFCFLCVNFCLMWHLPLNKLFFSMIEYSQKKSSHIKSHVERQFSKQFFCKDQTIERSNILFWDKKLMSSIVSDVNVVKNGNRC